MEEGPFTLEELNQAIDTLRPNKAGGPDELIIELFKDLDNENRLNILGLYNEIYNDVKSRHTSMKLWWFNFTSLESHQSITQVIDQLPS